MSKPFLIKIPPIYDDRGMFCEIWNKEIKQQAEIKEDFSQDNLSWSRQNVLRGLHMQSPFQSKLVRCSYGFITDIVVDLRPGDTMGEVFIFPLVDHTHWVYVPKGFAHGFYANESSYVHYKVDAPYNPQGQITLKWDDPELKIREKLKLFEEPFVSEKDKFGIPLAAFKK